jgi:hypothetical protein
MPTPGQELSSIDFESMIGGPLVAVINAQAQAAMSTVNFIKEVGFKKPKTEANAGDDTTTEEPIYVTFKYPKELSPYQPATAGDPSATPPVAATPAVPAVYETQQLQVPILTLLPIPFIRIEETTVDFNAKINSVSYRKTDTNSRWILQQRQSGMVVWAAKMKCQFFQRTTQQGNTVNRTYSLSIHVKRFRTKCLLEWKDVKHP